MSLLEIAEKMRDNTGPSGDPETTHAVADDLLCEMIMELGALLQETELCAEFVLDFDKVHKWYA